MAPEVSAARHERLNRIGSCRVRATGRGIVADGTAAYPPIWGCSRGRARSDLSRRSSELLGRAKADLSSSTR
jgi:hypothetical protein